MKSDVQPMLSHIIRFLHTIFIRMRLGLVFSSCWKVSGMVILWYSCWLLLISANMASAMRAAGAVTWVLTLLPSLIDEHLWSSMPRWSPVHRLSPVHRWSPCPLLCTLPSPSSVFPPSINLISLSSKFRSLMLGSCAPLHKFISPRAMPAAREYPSLSKCLSFTGFLPICDRAISDMLWDELPL